MDIRKTRIRQRYYLGTLLIALLLIVILSAVYLRVIRVNGEAQVEQLANRSIRMKKLHIKSIVDNTIQHIEVERDLIAKEKGDAVATLYRDALAHVAAKASLEDIKAHLKTVTAHEADIGVVIFDQASGKITDRFNYDLDLPDSGVLVSIVEVNKP